MGKAGYEFLYTADCVNFGVMLYVTEAVYSDVTMTDDIRSLGARPGIC